MKKTSNKSFLASAAYLVVALVLCAGLFFIQVMAVQD